MQLRDGLLYNQLANIWITIWPVPDEQGEF